MGLREQIIGQLADTPHVEPHRAVESAEDLVRRYDAERERKLREEIAAEILAMTVDPFGLFSERDPWAIRTRATRIAKGDA